MHVSATWCETCHAQKAVFEKLEEEENFRAFSFYTVDFDTQKDVMHTFYAPSRSTIIAFKLATKSDAGGDTSEVSAVMLKAMGSSAARASLRGSGRSRDRPGKQRDGAALRRLCD